MKGLRRRGPNGHTYCALWIQNLCNTVHGYAEEGVTLEAGAMDTLGKVAGGDMRKAITTLQSAVRLRVSSHPQVQACWEYFPYSLLCAWG